MFILPGFVIYALFVLLPIFSTVRYSFFDWTGFSQPTYIGFDNYARTDPRPGFLARDQQQRLFRHLLHHLPILIGLFLTSLMTRSKLRGMALFRTGLFIPQVMSPVVVGIIWRWLFTLDGPINQLLAAHRAGRRGCAPGSAISPTRATPSARSARGSNTGLCMVLFIAGMQNINEELYDAAKVFGANAWQQFRYVTLPACASKFWSPSC